MDTTVTSSCLGFELSEERSFEPKELASFRSVFSWRVALFLGTVVAIPAVPLVAILVAQAHRPSPFLDGVAFASIFASIFVFSISAIVQTRFLLRAVRSVREGTLLRFSGRSARAQFSPGERGVRMRLRIDDNAPHQIEVLSRSGYVWRVDGRSPRITLVPVSRVAGSPSRSYAVEIFRGDHVVVGRRHLSSEERAELSAHIAGFLRAGLGINIALLAAIALLGYLMSSADFVNNRRMLVVNATMFALILFTRGAAYLRSVRWAWRLRRGLRLGQLLVVTTASDPDTEVEILAASHALWRTNDTPAAWRVVSSAAHRTNA